MLAMQITRVLVAASLVAACGDNLAPPEAAPDCSLQPQPVSGWSLDAAREAYRRAALRQRLRYREAVEPGYVLRETALLADTERAAAGLVCPQELFEAGRILFEHAFSFEDGLASAGAAPFSRVQHGGEGPETTACVSCHWQRGPGGGGGLPDASFLLGDGDKTSSADARNAPALAGAGVLDALAREMTEELARARDAALKTAARTRRPTTIELVAKGVSFGELVVLPDGRFDTEGVRGIDPDLVVRPFGWKGTAATLVDVVASEAASHLGIADALTPGQVTAIATYLAMLDIPVTRTHETPLDRADPLGPSQPYLVEEWGRGRVLFEQVGCAGCHVPAMTLEAPTLRLAVPGTRGAVTVDLSRDGEAPRLARDAGASTYTVFVFSDLRRHDLGDDNASRHLHGGIGRRLYLTRPLWGLAGSAPYHHDGYAMTVDAAVRRHGGEGDVAREAWAQLPEADRSAIRIFLASLRRAPRLVVP